MPEAQNESTTSTYAPTLDTVVAQAYRRAGLLNVQQLPTPVQLNEGRLLLSELATKLNAEGVFMRQVQYGYVALVEDQNQYLLPESVIDIVGNGAYIDPTQDQAPFKAASETPVIMKDRDTWQGLASKAASSRPNLGYFARNAPQSTLFLWPTPGLSEVGGKVRFQFQQERPDLTLGTNTLPFERYWTSYFVFSLAVLLALDNSMLTTAAALQPFAAAEKEAAKGFSKQNVSVRVSINHMTGWQRRRW